MDEHKRGSREHGEEFWRAAVERIQGGEKVRAVARELGVDVRALYRWRDRFYPREQDPKRQREVELVKEVDRLKRALADKVLEVDFLRGALHKIEERRLQSGSDGGAASTTRSGK